MPDGSDFFKSNFGADTGGIPPGVGVFYKVVPDIAEMGK
jgi:hypothetical protein